MWARWTTVVAMLGLLPAGCCEQPASSSPPDPAVSPPSPSDPAAINGQAADPPSPPPGATRTSFSAGYMPHWELMGFPGLERYPQRKVEVHPPDASPRAERLSQALAATEKWVQLIDARRYKDSYVDTAASSPQAARYPFISLDEWVQQLAAVRADFGVPSERKFTRSTPDVFSYLRGPPGEYLLLYFELSFGEKSKGSEVVLAYHDGGEIWRFCSYLFRPGALRPPPEGPLLAALPEGIAAALNPQQRHLQEGERVSQAWLKLIDQGRYAESHRSASLLFRSALTEEQWSAQVAAERAKYGKLTQRTGYDQVHALTMPYAPDGQYVVARFAGAFQKKEECLETVTVTLDTDGKWRVTGYLIR